MTAGISNPTTTLRLLLYSIQQGDVVDKSLHNWWRVTTNSGLTLPLTLLSTSQIKLLNNRWIVYRMCAFTHNQFSKDLRIWQVLPQLIVGRGRQLDVSRSIQELAHKYINVVGWHASRSIQDTCSQIYNVKFVRQLPAFIPTFNWARTCSRQVPVQLMAGDDKQWADTAAHSLPATYSQINTEMTDRVSQLFAFNCTQFSKDLL